MANLAILGLLATLALFSGCLDDTPPATAPSDTDPSAGLPMDDVAAPAEPPNTTAGPATTDTTDIPFTVLAELGTPVSGTNVPSPVGPLRGGPFDVDEGVSLLAIDAEWTCLSGPLCTLALVLYDDQGEVTAVVDATDKAHVEVVRPASGEWGVSMFASMQGSAVVHAEGTIHVAVTTSTAPGTEATLDGSAPSANA
jgi:hypothetical protein